MRFIFSSKSKNCGIVFYNNKGKEVERLPFLQEERRGYIYRKDTDTSKYVYYLFYEDDILVPDWKAKALMPVKYGTQRKVLECKAVCQENSFDWDNDRHPGLSFQESLFYLLHVRGFTMHSSSGVKGKGTFNGISEKIPYLKDIGITTLELQPAYDFLEIDAELEKEHHQVKSGYPAYNPKESEKEKLNYWGYKEGFYYAPKAAYAEGDACVELKNLVRELHKNNMELVLQFYFPDTVKKSEISNILHFWVEEYHIDGFHLMGNDIPVDLIAEDDFLADTKLLFSQFNMDKLYPEKEFLSNKHLAEYQDSYMYDMRRFLKGDDNMMNTVLSQMRYIPEKAGRIHYLSNYNTFTLMDLVSYDYKHNEENGEENHDGNDYNASWNCGEEGVTKKRKIKQLRIKQVKNAMTILMMTQSTPLIFMGDEFGNSQKGNNNPYCQDNSLTWLDWSLIQKNNEIHEYWKKLVHFRKSHGILHPEKQLLLMDTMSCGYPDLSYHSENAWKVRTEGYIRHIGIMFCEAYEKKNYEIANGFIYFAMNMHWDGHLIGLPKLPQNMQWKLLLNTEEENKAKADETNVTVLERSDYIKEVAPRSIQVYVSVLNEEKKNKKERR